MTVTAGLDGLIAEAEGGGFDADERVVFAILDGVDRVVTERPEDQARRRAGRLACGESRPCVCRGGGDEDAPVEGEPEPDLRPPGDAFHQRIERDHGNGAERHQLGEVGQAQQHAEANEALSQQPDPRLLQATRRRRAAGEAPCARLSRQCRDRGCRYRCSPRRAWRWPRWRKARPATHRWARSRRAMRASASPIRQGRPSSQNPAGRSYRDSCRYGRANAGADATHEPRTASAGAVGAAGSVTAGPCGQIPCTGAEPDIAQSHERDTPASCRPRSWRGRRYPDRRRSGALPDARVASGCGRSGAGVQRTRRGVRCERLGGNQEHSAIAAGRSGARAGGRSRPVAAVCTAEEGQDGFPGRKGGRTWRRARSCRC
jgi:hypothetical protein